MHIKSPEEMFALGKELAKKHKNLLLHWELGAGKTLLTKWFAAWLGIDENKVQSPTYTYTNNYDNKLLHIDMYRLETVEDFVDKGIHSQIIESDFTVIERPKFTDRIEVKEFVSIHIEKLEDNTRNVIIMENVNS